MNFKLLKFLLFTICLSTSTVWVSGNSYTKLLNVGGAVYWESSFPKEVIGVKLTVKYQPKSDLEESMIETRYFAADEAIVYPFASAYEQPIFGDGSYKWEMSLIVGGANLLEPAAPNEGVDAPHDENGRMVRQQPGFESYTNAHRKIDASAKVTSGFFTVQNGSVLNSALNENESKSESNK